MWGKPPLYIPESFVVDVRDLQASRAWYKENLGFQDASADIRDDSGEPSVLLQLTKDDQYLSLVETKSPASARPSYGNVPPIFFASNLAKAYEWLIKRGVSVQPIERDSGGNELFHFQDLEGNRLEVCKET